MQLLDEIEENIENGRLIRGFSTVDKSSFSDTVSPPFLESIANRTMLSLSWFFLC
jgi:hypothetical protein